MTLLFASNKASLLLMTYCHVTAQTNKYLNEMGDADALNEAFAESDEYAEALAEFQQETGGTEQEFWNSHHFDYALEHYAEEMERRAADAWAESYAEDYGDW